MPCGNRLAAALAAAFFLPGPAAPTSVDINPVRIDLTGPGRPAELRLTNTGDSELAVQVDSFRWRQDIDGGDELSETDELLAVPPIFTIPPGGKQIVRIAFLGHADPASEGSYRLLVTELAPAGDQPAGGSALAMRMRFSIPAFIAPASAPARAEVVLHEVIASEAGTELVLRNAGNAHARLAQLELRGQSGWETLPTASTIRYLLPGVLATIPVPANFGPPSAVRIRTIDGRDWEYAVRLP